MFTQTWPQNNITTLRIKSGSDIGVTILDAIKFWVLSWTTDIESEEELDISYKLLLLFFECHECMKHFDVTFPTDIHWVIAKNIWPHREKFAYYQFMTWHTLKTRTSNSSKVEGGVVKHHSAGPKPNHSMEMSAESMVHLSNYRIELKEQKAGKDADSMPTKLTPALQPLYNNVSQYCADAVVQNWECRKHLTVYRAAINKFYIKDKMLKVKNPKPSNHKEYLQFLQPQFERTCIVEVIIIGGKLYLKCSCCEYEQCGYSCDGLFAVLNDIPSHQDIAIRWHKPYFVVYLTGDKELDKRFDVLVESQKPGPSLPCIHFRLQEGLCHWRVYQQPQQRVL
jgi:hypothetical protein